jgi:hypothetical protein
MKKQGWQRGDARQFAQAHLRGGSTTAPARRKGCLGNAVWMAFVYLAIDSDAPQCLRRWWGPPFFHHPAALFSPTRSSGVLQYPRQILAPCTARREQTNPAIVVN